MRFVPALFAAAVLSTSPACLGPVDELYDAGLGGGAGGGIGGGAGGGAGGGGGSTDAGLSCAELRSLYSQEQQAAKQCAPMLPVVQCTFRRPLLLGCPDCSMFVQNPATLDSIEAEYKLKNCGFGPCPFFCADPASGACVSDSTGTGGQCQDRF